jgi:hypothetical protein
MKKKNIAFAAMTAMVLSILTVFSLCGASNKANAANTPVASMIGARGPGGTLGDFLAANSAIGPLQTTRLFYPGSLPTSFRGSVADRLPAGVLPIVSYKTMNTNVASYVKSVNRPIWLCFHHEPEGDYSTGAQFVKQFDSQSNLIRSANISHYVSVAMIAGGYQYRDNRTAKYGSFIPPARYVDRYAEDVYQIPGTKYAWSSKGLANYPRFQNWLRLVRPTGIPIGITEYGISAAQGNAVRNARIKTDANYLRTTFGGQFRLWEYWWHSNDNSWQFTDAATIATWKSIAAGTF